MAIAVVALALFLPQPRLVAQDYPAPYSPLTQAEYFIGDDPGEGNGTPLSLTGSDGFARDLSQVTIPVGSLPAGMHEVNVRVRDEAGRWSNPLIRRFTISTFTIGGGQDPGAEGGVNFAKTHEPLELAEWFIGDDPGEGNGTPLALAGAEGLARDFADVTIPVGHLPAGTHEVKVRVRDEAGRWSNPLVRRFTVSSFTIAGGQDPGAGGGISFPKTHEPLQLAEWFIGSDPGEGNGTPLALAGSPGMARDLADVSIPIGDLPAGTHEVKVRVRDEAGRWSNPLIRRLTVSTFTVAGGVDPSDPNAPGLFPKPVQLLELAEYFVGDDPGEGNGIPLALAGSVGMARDLAEILVPVADLPHGSRNVGVRVRDEAGRWSNPLIRRFAIYRQQVLAEQRPGSKLVDLDFDLLHGPRPCTVTVFISGDGGQTWNVPNGSLTGDVGASVAPGLDKQVVWHAGEDWDDGFSENMKFRVVAYETVQDTPPGFSPVAAAAFTMGSPADEIGRGGDETTRAVTMGRPFFLKTTEVTWTEWNAVRSQGPAYGYTDIAAGRNGLNGDGSGNHPVIEVSWLDAVKWCNLKSEIEGRRPVYHASSSLNPATIVRTGIPTVHPLWNAGGYRLPTEAEWERACRGGTTTGFSSGAIADATTDPNLDVVGWYASNSGANTRPVSGKTANPLGFRDLHGNVREWCWDAYGSYAAGPQWDPVTGTAGAARVLRGGSWTMSAAACRSAARSSSGQNSRGSDIGFRVALNFQGGTLMENAAGIPVDSRDPEPGNLIAGMRPVVNGSVFTTLALPDGKLLIAGDFTMVDGYVRNRIARLNADGSMDPAFNPGADSTVHCAALLPGGKILLGGDFSTVASGPADFVARLNVNGSLDSSFRPQVDYVVRCLAIQADGKIVIGGEFQMIAGSGRNHVARLLPDGTLDAAFNPNVDGVVRTLAIQTNGAILLGGSFAAVSAQTRNRIARVLANGSLDGAFNPSANGDVLALAVESDDGILAGGNFSMIGGQSRSGVARLDLSGTVDSTFNPSVNGAVNTIVVQADGRIHIGGEFTTVGGTARGRIAALASSGALEPAFSLDFNGPVHSLHLLPSGRLVAGGDFTSVSGVARQRMAWLDNDVPTGTLAAMSGSRVRWLRGGSSAEASQVAFEISTNGGDSWLPLGAGSRVSDGWQRTGVNLPSSGLLRSTATIPAGRGNGSASLFSSTVPFSGLETVAEIAVEHPSGEGIADGGSLDFGTITLGATKSIGLTIRNIGYGDLTGLTVTKNGSHAQDFEIVTSPVAPVPGPVGSTSLVIRFNPGDAGVRSANLQISSNDSNESPYDIALTGGAVIAGQLADAADPQINGRVNAIAVQPDGKLLVGGGFMSFGTSSPVARGRFARLNPDLTLESAVTFAAGSGANSNVFAIAIQPDQRILVAGQFTTINSQSRPRIARVNPDGTLESTASFNVGTGPNNTIQTLALQPDGKIVIGGDFTNVGGTANPRSRIARLNADGTLEGTATFNIGSGADSQISCMALQPDGRIVIGGIFTTFNGQPRERLARLLPDGTLDPDFSPEADEKVSCIAVQPDGKILIGGLFASIDGTPVGRIARLLSDGTLDHLVAFDPGAGADGEVTSIVQQADGGILLAGAFTMVNEESRAGIARLYPNGTLEVSSTFETSFGADLTVRGLALRPDGSVLAGGDFTDYNGTPRGRLALLANQEAVNELRVPSHSRVEWDLLATAPAMTAVDLAISTNGGINWSPLPPMIRNAGSWGIDGLSLPSSGLVRARGRSAGGFASASSSLVEKVVAFVNAPLLTTLPATSVTTGSAVLNATVVPNGSAQVRFEFGPTPAFGFFTPAQTKSGGTSLGLSVPVENLSGLYYFRLIAETSGGTYYGGTLSFMTAPFLPEAVTGNPISVTTSTATLIGAVNPKGRQTTVHFEYGTTGLYGNTTAAQVLAPGDSPVEMSAPISGLAANATYHCRIVAVNSAGTAFGSSVTFQASNGGNPTAPPSVTTGGFTDVSTSAAVLLGTVNPNGGFTNAFFEYGLDEALGSVSPNLGAGNGSVPANISWTVTGLQPGTTYHYRLVASNAQGTTPGTIRTLTTDFLPPLVVTDTAVPIGTTGARISGSVRARGSSAQVFLDYGIDGASFPNSVGAMPAMVDGDVETVVTADLTNLQQGVTYHYRMRAVNLGGAGVGQAGSFTPAIPSGLDRKFPNAPPAATGSVTVTLTPVGIASGWRFAGERQWRPSGATAGEMTTGDRVIEFRPTPGYVQPLPELAVIVSGAATLEIERDYIDTEIRGSGGLIVSLYPQTLAAETVPAGERARWRFEGEDDTQWKDSGTIISELAAGNYLIECKPVSGRSTPSLVEVTISVGESTSASITYFIASAAVGVAPVLQDFSSVSTDAVLPHGFVGQIRTPAGLSSGFVVKQRVVATAGHVVFDDATLTFVSDPQWLFQRDKGTFEPEPLVPRGFYVFDGYSAQRIEENTPGVSSPQSQNLDVAAMYFTEDAGREGFSGFLASDTTTNEFLNSDSLKILAGYPVDGVSAAGQGRMFATPPTAFAFTQEFGRTHSTTAIRGAGGMSGGPLCVRHSNGNYYPAAVFLGGSAQTVVRAIDSSVIDLFNRAGVSGGGGDNNTGGGITHSSFSGIGSLEAEGAVTVTILPAAARNAGAGWRLSARQSFKNSGDVIGNLSEGIYTLRMSTVSGYPEPKNLPVEVKRGKTSNIIFDYLEINTAPVISSLANQSINEDATTGAIAFTVGDDESSAGSLTITRSSSNVALVPNANIVIGGSGANRTVTVTPEPDQSGTAIITITVSDGALSASRAFTLTVNPVNDPPVLSAIGNQNPALGTSVGPIAFTVADVETSASALTVGAVSSNPALVPPTSITFAGSAGNRNITIVPVTGQLGSTTVTLTVSDGAANAARSFIVTVGGSLIEEWRFANFGDARSAGDAGDTFDADADGSSNRDEYAAGTNPNDPADVFRVLSSARLGNSFRVTIPAKPGRSYSLERSASPAGPGWTRVAVAGPPAAPGGLDLIDPAPPAGTGFYRVVVEAP